jgi:hypothetical protein
MESKWRDVVSPVERNHLTQLVYVAILYGSKFRYWLGASLCPGKACC